MSERVSPSEPRARRASSAWFAGFGLRESLFLTLCALLLVATKVLFRFKLGIPGHSAIFMAFFLVLGRSLVDRTFAATLTAFMAGVLIMALGLGKSGPLALVQLMIPGLLVDGLAFFGLARTLLGATVLGLAAGFGRGPAQAGGFLLVGMEAKVALATTALRLIPAMLFGAAGGCLAALVARRLRRAGLTPGEGLS